MLLINPGSEIGTEQRGWTNTFEGAEAEAERWLKSMHEDDGMVDVELVRRCSTPHEGRWTFTYRHKVTGVEVKLDTHGIDNLDAYKDKNGFHPRVYWNGSSTSKPSIDDFAAPGFRKLVTFVPSR